MIEPKPETQKQDKFIEFVVEGKTVKVPHSEVASKLPDDLEIDLKEEGQVIKKTFGETKAERMRQDDYSRNMDKVSKLKKDYETKLQEHDEIQRLAKEAMDEEKLDNPPTNPYSKEVASDDNDILASLSELDKVNLLEDPENAWNKQRQVITKLGQTLLASRKESASRKEAEEKKWQDYDKKQQANRAVERDFNLAKKSHQWLNEELEQFDKNKTQLFIMASQNPENANKSMKEIADEVDSSFNDYITKKHIDPYLARLNEKQQQTPAPPGTQAVTSQPVEQITEGTLDETFDKAKEKYRVKIPGIE